MISKTIGFRGLAYFQTNPYDDIMDAMPNMLCVWYIYLHLGDF